MYDSLELFSFWFPDYSFQFSYWVQSIHNHLGFHQRCKMTPMQISQDLFLNSLLHLGILPLNMQLQQTPWTLTPVRLPYKVRDPPPCSVVQKDFPGRSQCNHGDFLIFPLWDYTVQLPIVQYLIAVVLYSFLVSSVLRWVGKLCPCDSIITGHRKVDTLFFLDLDNYRLKLQKLEVFIFLLFTANITKIQNL